MADRFAIEAQLMGVRFTADKGLSLGFHTREVSTEEACTIAQHHQRAGWLVWSDNAVSEADIPKEKADIDRDKSPARRLRAVLFLLHKRRMGKPEDFEGMYRTEMEKIIEHYKGKLEVEF